MNNILKYYYIFTEKAYFEVIFYENANDYLKQLKLKFMFYE